VITCVQIAYMDHLDIPKDLGTHQICYDVPRICNVSKKDFEFVMSVDMQSPELHSYGRLPVCTIMLLFLSFWSFINAVHLI
jgi:hypothetical protein